MKLTKLISLSVILLFMSRIKAVFLLYPQVTSHSVKSWNYMRYAMVSWYGLSFVIFRFPDLRANLVQMMCKGRRTGTF